MFGSKKKRILEDGIQARAVITNVADTGMTVNDSPRVKLTLQVQPDGDMPFEATKKTLVSRLQIPRIGDTLWVRYDPADRQHVEIDTAKNQAAGATVRTSINLGTASVKVNEGSTVIDARSVPGLRDELMKAVADAQSGNPGAQAELQAAVQKAMAEGQAVAKAWGVPAPGAGALGASVGATPAVEDPLDRIKKLNDLRVAGALTDAEFEAQKAKILGEC